MHMFRSILKKISLAAAAAVLLTPVAAVAGDGQPITFTIIAQAPGTGPYGYATSMSKFMKDALPEGSTVNVVPRGGSTANPTTLQMGKGDVGFSATCSTQWAWDGSTEMYARHGKHDKIRYVSPGNGAININYNFVVARKDFVEKTGIDTVEKLLNAKDMPRIAMKPQGSVVPPIFEQMFAFLGKDLDEYRKAGRLIQIQPSQIGEMMRDGRVDIYCESTTLNHPSVTEIALTNDLVFLPIPKSIEKQMISIGMFPTVMKAGGYRGLNEDYPTTATGNNIIANVDAPEEAIYLLTKALIERYDELVEDNPQLRDWDPKNNTDRSGMTVPLHPGAERYYREVGMMK